MFRFWDDLIWVFWGMVIGGFGICGFVDLLILGICGFWDSTNQGSVPLSSIHYVSA